MVCYARPAIRMAALVLVASLIFERPVGHFFDAAALVVAITVAVAVAAALAALAFAVFLSTRRRRARAGGCVSCTLRCQHPMTEGSRRLRLVSITDRTQSTSPAPAAASVAPGIRAVVPAGRSLPVVSVNGRPSLSSSPSSSPGHPHWPDRPARRVPERVGS